MEHVYMEIVQIFCQNPEGIGKRFPFYYLNCHEEFSRVKFHIARRILNFLGHLLHGHVKQKIVHA